MRTGSQEVGAPAIRWRALVVTGIAAGVAAPVLVAAGNPGNMGLCLGCFLRDVAGALRLHDFLPGRAVRPEIPGFLLGALASALVFGELRPRRAAAPATRFLLGMLAMLGLLVFLGCPWRAWLRLAGGDLNALLGVAGLGAGVVIAEGLRRRGLVPREGGAASAASGLALPVLLAGILLAALLGVLPATSGQALAGMRAPVLLCLGAGLLVGALAQRSRFCAVGALADPILRRRWGVLPGVLGLLGAAVATKLALGQFRIGFAGQPVAHANALANFGGMALAGTAFSLGGGCPGRQLARAGEGDAGAAVFLLGMLAGAGAVHHAGLASSPAGPTAAGGTALAVGLALAVLLAVAPVLRRRAVTPRGSGRPPG